MVADLCSSPTDERRSTVNDELYLSERARLGVDEAMEDDWSQSINYMLKKHPGRFLRAMAYMSREKESAGRGSFSLFPLRRSLVPCHVRFDATGFRESIAAIQKKRMKILGKRRRDEDMMQSCNITFDSLFDYKRAGVRQVHLIKEGFTTDGVCARIQQQLGVPKHQEGCSLPRRGFWTIDELKRTNARLDDLHVVGVDPGKRELIVATDMDNPTSTPVRYTLRRKPVSS